MCNLSITAVDGTVTRGRVEVTVDGTATDCDAVTVRVQDGTYEDTTVISPASSGAWTARFAYDVPSQPEGASFDVDARPVDVFADAEGENARTTYWRDPVPPSPDAPADAGSRSADAAADRVTGTATRNPPRNPPRAAQDGASGSSADWMDVSLSDVVDAAQSDSHPTNPAHTSTARGGDGGGDRGAQQQPQTASERRQATQPRSARARRPERTASPAPRACPDVYVEPVEVGAPDAEGIAPVSIEAVVDHPLHEPIAARLRDGLTGDVLVEERSERGWVRLTYSGRYRPGEYPIAVEIVDPDNCAGAKTSFVVDKADTASGWSLPFTEDDSAPDARADARADARGMPAASADSAAASTSQASAGTRALGFAWSVVAGFYLLTLAAGGTAFLVGMASSALFVFGAPFLAARPGDWPGATARGLGIAGLGLAFGLPYVPLIGFDADLVASGIAAAGLAFAAIVVAFTR